MLKAHLGLASKDKGTQHLGLVWRESPWLCEYALVRETPEMAAEVALFDRLLTDTSVNGAYHYYIHTYTKRLLIKRSYFHDK